MTTAALDFRSLWGEAIPWARYLNPEMERFSLWDGISRHVRVPDGAAAELRELPVRRFLVLAEDWCGDAANTVPVVAALAEAVAGTELRVLPRDEYLDVMDRYLTNGARSIPVVIALGSDFEELARWGPRPSELQSWFVANRDTIPKDVRYAEMRRWYARDKGESTVREVLAAIRSSSRSPSKN